MEEMQRAFNKTIIKLENTSRIAEEQVSDNLHHSGHHSWHHSRTSIHCSSRKFENRNTLSKKRKSIKGCMRVSQYYKLAAP